jgi:hypothetical protein
MPNFIFYDKSSGQIFSRITGAQDLPLDRAKVLLRPFNPQGGELATITDSESSMLASEGHENFKYNPSTKKVERK